MSETNRIAALINRSTPTAHLEQSLSTGQTPFTAPTTSTGTTGTTGGTGTTGTTNGGTGTTGGGTPAKQGPDPQHFKGVGKNPAQLVANAHQIANNHITVHKNANGSLTVTVPKGPHNPQPIHLRVKPGQNLRLDLSHKANGQVAVKTQPVKPAAPSKGGTGGTGTGTGGTGTGTGTGGTGTGTDPTTGTGTDPTTGTGTSPTTGTGTDPATGTGTSPTTGTGTDPAAGTGTDPAAGTGDGTGGGSGGGGGDIPSVPTSAATTPTTTTTAPTTTTTAPTTTTTTTATDAGGIPKAQIQALGQAFNEGPATDLANAKKDAGAIGVGYPGFGVIGIPLEQAHASAINSAVDTLNQGSTAFTNWASGMASTGTNWELTETANTDAINGISTGGI